MAVRPTVSIRDAVVADDAFLARLYADRRAGDLGTAPLPPEQLAALLAVQFRAQRRGYAAAFPAASDRVALVAGQPVGRLLVDRGPATHRIVDVAVLSSHRGLGVGTALLRLVLDEAAGAGAHVALSAAAHDLRLLGWYRGLGFSVPDIPSTGPGGPDVEMRCPPPTTST